MAKKLKGLTPKMMEAEEIRTLLSWEAPVRPYRVSLLVGIFISGTF